MRLHTMRLHPMRLNTMRTHTQCARTQCARAQSARTQCAHTQCPRTQCARTHNARANNARRHDNVQAPHKPGQFLRFSRKDGGECCSCCSFIHTCYPPGTKVSDIVTSCKDPDFHQKYMEGLSEYELASQNSPNGRVERALRPQEIPQVIVAIIIFLFTSNFVLLFLLVLLLLPIY